MRKRWFILDKKKALFGIIPLVVGLLGLFGFLYYEILHPELGLRVVADLFLIYTGVLVLVGAGMLAWYVARVERDSLDKISRRTKAIGIVCVLLAIALAATYAFYGIFSAIGLLVMVLTIVFLVLTFCSGRKPWD